MVGSDWERSNNEPIPKDQRSSLVSRYLLSGVEPGTVIAALHDVTAQSSALRYTRELENMRRLGIDPAIIKASEALHDRRIHTAYFLRQLGSWSYAASRSDYHHDPKQEFDKYKYGLELYGVIQHGDWNATANIDAAIRGLPEQLEVEYKDAHTLTNYDKKAKAKLSYRYQPLLHLDQHPVRICDMEVESPYDFGVVRRRRAVADVAFRGLPVVVEVFKESTALVLVDLLPPIEQKILKERRSLLAVGKKHMSTLDPDDLLIVDSANKFAGKRFELGIEDSRRESRDIIPVSSNYIAKVTIEA